MGQNSEKKKKTLLIIDGRLDSESAGGPVLRMFLSSRLWKSQKITFLSTNMYKINLEMNIRYIPLWSYEDKWDARN